MIYTKIQTIIKLSLISTYLLLTYYELIKVQRIQFSMHFRLNIESSKLFCYMN